MTAVMQISRLGINLVGTKGNRDAVGARAVTQAAGAETNNGWAARATAQPPIRGCFSGSEAASG